jgi:D-alanyl-D-alanine carboxypeptidase
MSVTVSRTWAMEFVVIGVCLCCHPRRYALRVRVTRSLSVVVIATLAAVLLAVSALAEPVTDLRARLDEAIAAKVDQMDIPGAIVGLSIPGRLDYVRAVGVGDSATGTPLTVADHTRVGSVTKTFTGTAVLQLVDDGRIRLSDPIADYVDGVPSGEQITLDMLGRMRSGLYSYTDDDEFVRQMYAEAPQGPDTFAFTPAELLGIAFRHPLNFAPGAEYEYSNTNTVLLGLVVEKVSGLPLGEFFAQRIFGPLGLRETSYPSNGLVPEPFAHGYTALPGGPVVDATLWNPSWADAAGRVVSDVADMAKWAAALGRGSLLTPQTQAQRAQVAGAYPGVGYGFALFNTHGWLGHNGDIPGYATVVVYLPEHDATLVVLANSDVPEDHSAGQLATLVTSIATPDHVYNLAS